MTAAPYPADTRAKGWRFEIDMEKARQSDTWALTLQRGWEPKALLVWMWSVAWEQTPCGSLPNDEELIAARLELPAKVWEKHRAILMRNWWLADDGRLYHDIIVSRVLAMLAKRASDAERAANRRARTSASDDSPPESRVTNGGVNREFDTKHRVPSTTEPTVQKEPRKRATPCPDDVAEQVWADWVALRKAKRATVSATAIEEARKEASKAGMTLDAFLRVWCARGSQGLFADWLKPHERQQQPTETFAQRAARERVQQMSPRLAAKAPGAAQQPNFEVIDGTTKLLA